MPEVNSNLSALASKDFSALLSTNLDENSSAILKEDGRVGKQGLISKLKTCFSSEARKTANEQTINQLANTLKAHGLPKSHLDSIRNNPDIISGKRMIKGSDLTAIQSAPTSPGRNQAAILARTQSTLAAFTTNNINSAHLPKASAVLLSLIQNKEDFTNCSPIQIEELATKTMNILFDGVKTEAQIRELLDQLTSDGFNDVMIAITAGSIYQDNASSPRSHEFLAKSEMFVDHLISQTSEALAIFQNSDDFPQRPASPTQAKIAQVVSSTLSLPTDSPLKSALQSLGFAALDINTMQSEFTDYCRSVSEGRINLATFVRDNYPVTSFLRNAVSRSLMELDTLAIARNTSTFTKQICLDFYNQLKNIPAESRTEQQKEALAKFAVHFFNQNNQLLTAAAAGTLDITLDMLIANEVRSYIKGAVLETPLRSATDISSLPENIQDLILSIIHNEYSAAAKTAPDQRTDETKALLRAYADHFFADSPLKEAVANGTHSLAKTELEALKDKLIPFVFANNLANSNLEKRVIIENGTEVTTISAKTAVLDRGLAVDASINEVMQHIIQNGLLASIAPQIKAVYEPLAQIIEQQLGKSKETLRADEVAKRITEGTDPNAPFPSYLDFTASQIEETKNKLFSTLILSATATIIAEVHNQAGLTQTDRGMIFELNTYLQAGMATNSQAVIDFRNALLA